VEFFVGLFLLKGEWVCKPSSVSPKGRRPFNLTGCCQPTLSFDKRPTRRPNAKILARAGQTGILGLAGGGVYHAGGVTVAAVRSYRTISPLPEP